jgi:hypothetical protein
VHCELFGEGVRQRRPGIAQALFWAMGSVLAASQFRQKMTPRKVQMMQMNVPQFVHG